MVRWDKTTTGEFVKLYLGHESLWNPKHEDYNQRFRRQMTYKQIMHDFKVATNISLTEPEARRKIRTLRTTYYQELDKARKHGRIPKLFWFADFHKCLQQLPSRRIKDVYDEQDSTDNTLVWVIENSEDNLNNDTDKEIDETQGIPNHNAITVKIEPEDTDGEIENTHRPVISRKRRIKRHSSSSTSEQTCRNMDVNNEDEFDIYDSTVNKLVSVTENSEDNLNDDTDKDVHQTQGLPNHNIIALKIDHEDSNREIDSTNRPLKSRDTRIKQHSSSINTSEQTYRSSMDVSKEDEFDIYAKYIASQLRRMDLQRALRVQRLIQDIVSENRIEEAKENDL